MAISNSRKKNLVGICAYNEGEKIKRVISRFSDYSLYDVLLIDDGSNDHSLEKIPAESPIDIIVNERTMGAGFGTRQTIEYAIKNGYENIIFVSGNDKDDPLDVSVLMGAIDKGYDFVQGSRYLPGGQFGRMPFYRRVATRFIHPLIFSLITNRKITDSTNGFRAIKTKFFNDKRLNIYQDWLDQYELEPYLFYKAIKLGYKVTEVPVKKIYPPKKQGYTKMKPITGWWSILRPLIYLALGIKK